MAEAAIPSRHELRSAHLLARALRPPVTASAEAHQAFRRLPGGGGFGPADFDGAKRVLISAGLLVQEGDELRVDAAMVGLAEIGEPAASRLFLDLLLRRSPPGWLRPAASAGRLKHDLIPDAERVAIETVIGDPALCTEVLLQAGRRLEAERLAELAAAGEEHVVACCREQLVDAGLGELVGAVARVGGLGAELGYQVIAPGLDGSTRRLGVKATRTEHWRSEIHVTRDEYEQGILDPDWALVVVEVAPAGEPKLIGWCRAESILSRLPRDEHELGNWGTARIEEVEVLLQEGLPPC